MAGKDRTQVEDYAYTPSAFSSHRKIAIVHVDGNIVDGESGSPVMGGSFVGDKTIADILDDVRKDDSVVAVVLRVNSPGGSGLASDNMWHDLARTKAAGKPIVVSMGDYAASGGYYISSGADKIIAEPGTLTGSIGVFGGKINLGGLYEHVGVTMHTYQRGALAGLLSSTSDFSDPERAKFRQFLEGFYQTFLARVSEGRKMPVDKVHEVAQGRVWTGQQALERGLVDELGGIDLAITRARELANVPTTEDLDIERYPRRKTFVDSLMEDLEKGQSSLTVKLPPELQTGAVHDAFVTAWTLDRVFADGGVAAMLPGTIAVK
jgi:protease-4